MSEAPPRNSVTRVLEAGTRLGKFELRQLLGRGGFGEVWRAYDQIERVERAVKVMLPTAFEQQGLVERFLREARVAVGLRHPNVVRTFEPNQTDDGFVYLPMELMRGQALADVLKAHGAKPMEPALVLRFVAPICRGVGYLHGKGLVHRDLKPANVFLHQDADDAELVVPKVIDFGAIKVLESEDDRSSTNAPSPMTLRYAAPEQLLGHKHEIDARTDVFALGVLLYEMLSGRRAFNAASTAEHYARALRDTPVVPLREHAPEVSSALEAVVLRALSRERAKRQENAEALLSELAAAAGDDSTELTLTTTDLKSVPEAGAKTDKPPLPLTGSGIGPTTVTRSVTVTVSRTGAVAIACLAVSLLVTTGVLLSRALSASGTHAAAASTNAPVAAVASAPNSSAMVAAPLGVPSALPSNTAAPAASVLATPVPAPRSLEPPSAPRAAPPARVPLEARGTRMLAAPRSVEASSAPVVPSVAPSVAPTPVRPSVAPTPPPESTGANGAHIVEKSTRKECS